MTFLIGITHGRPDRFRPEVRSVDERVSLTAVVEAVSDIMEASNRGGVVDRALASRIGSQIQAAVADALGSGRISSGAQLVGQQAFRNILSQHLATTSSSYADQAARQSMLDFMRRHANRTGADFANFVAQFRRGGGYADRGSDRDGAGLLTSARFDGFSGADAALLSAMRRYAIDQGLDWAANRPEILRMGHEAIRLLASTGFTSESHDRLHEAGFNHHDMVHIARHAERHGIDVNRLAEEVARTPGILGGGNARAEQEWRDRLKRLFENPNDEEARRDIGRRLDEIEARGMPEQREHALRLRPLLKLEAQVTAELSATATQDATRQQADHARLAEERRIAEERRLEAERARVAAAAAEDAYAATPTGTREGQRAEAVQPVADRQHTARASQLSGNTPQL